MSYTLRTARVAYDNISSTGASGTTGVTGRERTILSNAGSTEKLGGGSNVSVASSEPSSNARNRMIASSGAGVTTLPPRENINSTQ